ncbi:MAG TPA: hypothetical protein PL056_12810 [bacterium]|nr:hypothetical protein [bacterium]
MRFTTLLLIVSIFTFVFDGKELCFKNNGEVHLSCCCKDSPSIKMPCCGNNCKTVDVPSIDIAQHKPENENSLNPKSDNSFFVSFYNNVSVSILLKVPVFSPIYRSDHSYRSRPLSNLSTIVLRC